MGYTLDQLLDAAGMDNVTGPPLQKTAANRPPDLLKLAERCRSAAEESPPASPPGNTVNEQALVEKTAAVAIIRRTLAEIREIEGTPPEATKTASPRGTDPAAFIKAALEEGHSPEDIARFLEGNAEDEQAKRKKKTATTIVE
jgi:hypothetical protein